ncbi:MAG: T9SS type A sorting domain-containing protein [Planctomycetia bacterium]|nr:T9SS type A sorting domain-containing protein [Planctomycetia bacterium]
MDRKHFIVMSLFLSFTSYIISQDVQNKYDHIRPYSNFQGSSTYEQFINQLSSKESSQDGRLTEQIDQMWNNSESTWHNDQRTTYEYYTNSSGKLFHKEEGEIQQIVYKEVWHSSQRWDMNKRTTTEIDRYTHIITKVTENWNGSEWDLETKTVSQGLGVDQGGLTINETIIYVWIDGEWVYSERRVYLSAIVDDQENVYNEEVEVWTGSEWQYSQRKLYAYDYDGELTHVAWSLWENGIWEDYRLETYNYAYGKILSNQSAFNPYQILLEDITNGGSTNLALWTYSYDADGDLIEDLWQSWNGQSWQDLSLTTYSREDVSVGKVSNKFSVKRETLMLMKLWQNGSWIDFWRKWSSYEDSQVGTRGETDVPVQFMLGQNFPNPFNPATTIQFNVASSVHVELTIHNLLGRKVLTLINSEYQPGQYSVTFNANQLTAGIFFYKVIMGDYTAVNKMVVLK